MTYLRYAPDIETSEADEQETIDSIIKGMTQQSETVDERERHAVRASHAKSSACAIGEMSVADDLPKELVQGLFAQGGTFPVAVRFAQGPGETLGARVGTHRGMAIKIFGATGEKLPEHGADIQDFRAGATVAFFGAHDVVFELRVQLRTNAETQPIEDASVEWSAEDSRYRTVATIRLLRQDAYSPARVRYFDAEMLFRPANSLAAHRPLGGVMRARLQVYRAASAFRHRENNVAEANPAGVGDIPS